MLPIALALAQIAPGIIQYFTGSEKAANVAAKVVDIAQTITGTEAPEAALAALQADPAKALEFQQAVLNADIELTKAQLADVQSARHMQEIALGQDDLFSKRFVYYFASGWSLFAMIYFAGVTFGTVTEDGRRVADTILGVLISSVLGSMMAYFYGSTKGSAEKTRLLAASTPK